MAIEKLEQLEKHIKQVFEEKRLEILTYYSRIKLQIPAHVKTLTLKEFKEAGGSFDSILSITDELIGEAEKKAESRQTLQLVLNKVEETVEFEKTQIKEYYQKLKQRIPVTLLNKTLGELTDDEKIQLGFQLE